MMDVFAEQVDRLPSLLFPHLRITMLSLLLGFGFSLPLALLAVVRRRLRYPLLAVVSVVQTFPSLALLALFAALLIGLRSVSIRYWGIDFRALGFKPTIMALTLYSMLPMLRNMVTGILEVDPALTEAARGMGMTRAQSLWKVELPLALPVIIAGVRTATVWTVGIATLATPVGQDCLGNYIFAGLQTQNWVEVIFGCVVAALLALLLDMLIGGLQKAADERRRGLALVTGITLALLLVVGLTAQTVIAWLQPRAVIIGSKTFTEQYILAELLADTLEEAGVVTRKKQSLGSTVAFGGVTSGDIDCYVDYTGTIWANYMNREGSAPPDEVLERVTSWLEQQHDVACLGTLGFENAYALAMRRQQAQTLGIRTIGDLASYAPEMHIGGDYEFFSRPEWRAIKRAYGLDFADRQTYDSTFMYTALVAGEVDVISAFSSDGRIEEYDLVLLDDPRRAIPPYDAVVLLSPATAQRDEVVETLRPLLGTIELPTMQHANFLVDRQENKQTINQAAAWLRKQIQTKSQTESSQSSGAARQSEDDG
jgi:osmoprotectant transport system permease protein